MERGPRPLVHLVTARWLARIERYVPFVVVAVSLGLLAVGLRDVLTSVYLNGDAASGAVIAELLGELVAALTVFWGAALLALFVAFVSTSAVVDALSFRYLLGAWPAVLVLVTLLLRPRAGSLVLAFVAVVIGGFGIDRLARDEYEDNPSRFAEGYAAGSSRSWSSVRVSTTATRATGLRRS